jgi:CheY-like chemotaxis protein
MAGEGVEAAATYAHHRQDIKAVITDLAMAGMDGVALTRVLRNQDPQLPILISTGLGQEAVVAELQGLGVEIFLAKPYTADPLLAALQKALGRRT